MKAPCTFAELTSLGGDPATWRRGCREAARLDYICTPCASTVAPGSACVWQELDMLNTSVDHQAICLELTLPGAKQTERAPAFVRAVKFESGMLDNPQ
eukprot:3077688-Alexandrium_andersonii.AAC.1